ncbi:MAG: hypothetical protein ACUVRH_02190 [Candidatus Bipolaricaulia bacterium]
MRRKTVLLAIGLLVVLLLLSAVGAASTFWAVRLTDYRVEQGGCGVDCYALIVRNTDDGLNKFGIGFEKPVELLNCLAVGGGQVCKIEGGGNYWRIWLKNDLWPRGTLICTFKPYSKVKFIFGFKVDSQQLPVECK